jgi:dihydroxy-acid dehydratase
LEEISNFQSKSCQRKISRKKELSNLTEEEIALRMEKKANKAELHTRGYVRLYQEHVEQAHLGADLNFLKGGSGSEVPRDSP